MALKFFDYQSSGKGVSKQAPQKKPFFKYFEIFGRKFWKIIELNLLFLLFSLPIVTFGPAMAAMTHVMRKFTIEQPCFLFDEFFTAFKKNFKQSIAIGIVDVLFIASFVVLFISLLFSKTGLPDGSLIYLCIFVGVSSIFFMMHFYIYLEIVALNLKMKAILKNSLFLVFLGVKRNFIALLINIAIITLVVLFLPYSIFAVIFLPIGIACFTTVFICYPVIQKYIVNPYYEERGERNPELPPVAGDDGEDVVFTDMGGKEEAIDAADNRSQRKAARAEAVSGGKAAPRSHGKVIK